jgi:hypothetical protein
MADLVKLLRHNPKTIFLLDGLGAMMTGVSIILIKTFFVDYFGMSSDALIYLATIAWGLALYSMTCYFALDDNWRPFLRPLLIANVFYCFLTSWLLIAFAKTLTIFGYAYFLSEMVLISALVYVEVQISRSCSDL